MGSRLQALLKSERGKYKDLAARMLEYRKPRKNGGNKEYNLLPLYKDGHNITLHTLTGLIRLTGMPLEFFVDFENGELSSSQSFTGSNNIINSSISTSNMENEISHLREVISLKDQMLADKERIIEMKSSEIEQWKNRYDNLVKSNIFEDSDINKT